MQLVTRIPFRIADIHNPSDFHVIEPGTIVTQLNVEGELYFIELPDTRKTRTWVGKSKLHTEKGSFEVRDESDVVHVKNISYEAALKAANLRNAQDPSCWSAPFPAGGYAR